jgi:hypothetical protein
VRRNRWCGSGGTVQPGRWTWSRLTCHPGRSAEPHRVVGVGGDLEPGRKRLIGEADVRQLHRLSSKRDVTVGVCRSLADTSVRPRPRRGSPRSGLSLDASFLREPRSASSTESSEVRWGPASELPCYTMDRSMRTPHQRLPLAQRLIGNHLGPQAPRPTQAFTAGKSIAHRHLHQPLSGGWNSKNSDLTSLGLSPGISQAWSFE